MLKHARKLRLSLLTRGRRLAVAIPLCVMLAGVATPQVQGQATWGGSVEVSTTSLTVPPGQSLTYHLRLTEPPTADGWWVVLRVDGGMRPDGCYKGFRWVPSVGWPYKPGNYDTWRGVTFWADEECGPAGTVTITHEVWDETTFCPWKGSPVTVDVGDAVDVGGPLPSLSVGDATVEEGGTAEFEVTLEQPSSQTVTVAFATADDTAQAGTDYESRSGTLRFTVGQTVQTIRVPTVDDTFHESEERFTLTLSNPSGATLDIAAGKGTITDNDLPELSIGNALVEEGETAEFEVRLSPASDRTVTVAYATAERHGGGARRLHLEIGDADVYGGGDNDDHLGADRRRQ